MRRAQRTQGAGIPLIQAESPWNPGNNWGGGGVGESRTAFPRSLGTLGLEKGGSKLMDLFYGAVPGTSVQVGQSEHWGTEFPLRGSCSPVPTLA